MSTYLYPYLPTNPYYKEMVATTKKICTPGRGILAADESTGTIGKRLASIGLPNTRPNRRNYRKLLFTTKGLNKYISGVITFEETLYETVSPAKTPLISFLQEQDIVVGIKVDKGTRLLPGTDGEKYAQGLTDLDKRTKRYYKGGARFAKWRSVVKISRTAPSAYCIQETAHTLARYAAICQANGLVPIVEPEILMDGEHSLEICQYWTEKVLAACYKALSDQNVIMECTLLKPNMVLPGKECKTQVDSKAVGAATVRALQRAVPAAVPGIVFLSGGQSEAQASANLSAINGAGLGARPWHLSFSFGRALQQSCLKAWMGKESNVKAAQAALLKRAFLNSEAQLGRYDAKDETASASASLYQKNYTY